VAISFSMTAGDIVKRAMQARRCLALGRTPTAAESEYGLERLNQLLKTLAGDGIGPEIETTATITANVAEVALSPRPADVLSVSLVVSSTNHRLLTYWESEAYKELPNKTQSGEPSMWTLRKTQTATYLRVWPVPTANRTIAYSYTRTLEDVAAATALDVPQEWLEAIEMMLAIRLTAFANNNPDLVGLAQMHERRLYDWSRPDSYTFEAGCCA
jgi:hypothetical protein